MSGSNLVKEMETLKSRVTNLLMDNRWLRDDYIGTLLEIWKADNITPALNGGIMFFENWLRERATDPESVRRTWQQIQELNVNLRGKGWAERHKQGDLVREEIKGGAK